jgi:predicted regulator of Ras-like GTPase activity (Roadblock/LC7/MglB family)
MEKLKSIGNRGKGEDLAKNQSMGTGEKGRIRISKDTKIYLIIAGCFVIVLAGMFIWKALAVKNVEVKSQQIVARKTQELLRLSGIPLSWAVRREMISENYDQINEYLARFVKEPNIKLIVVVKADGIIVAATDKKLEGTTFSALFPKDLLQLDGISVTADKKGDIQITAPIMGFNTRLGLMILIYTPEKIDL